MTLRVEDYTGRFRDTDVERELSSRLRELPEAERLQFITELIDTRLPKSFAVALWLAKTCLKERHSFEAILARGLEEGDASTIKHWIEAVIHGLGLRRTLRLVHERIATDPESVVRAIYWLRMHIPENDSKATAAFTELEQAVKRSIDEDPSILTRAKPFLRSGDKTKDAADEDSNAE